MKKNRGDEKDPVRVGRPRANKKTPSGPVREEILIAARALFKEKGFRGTSTREIAELAGLRQPSLFHYFKNKDEIFREIVLSTVQPVLEVIEEEREKNFPPEIALFRFLRFDTYHLCTNENMIGTPGQFPELSQVHQPDFYKLRQDIFDYIAELLSAGIKKGAFNPQDLSILSHLVFGLLESMLSWYQDSEVADAKLVANTVAAFVLRAILSDETKLDYIISHAGPLEYNLPESMT